MLCPPYSVRLCTSMILFAGLLPLPFCFSCTYRSSSMVPKVRFRTSRLILKVGVSMPFSGVHSSAERCTALGIS